MMLLLACFTFYHVCVVLSKHLAEATDQTLAVTDSSVLGNVFRDAELTVQVHIAREEGSNKHSFFVAGTTDSINKANITIPW